MAAHGRAWPRMAWHDKAWHGHVWPGMAWPRMVGAPLTIIAAATIAVTGTDMAYCAVYGSAKWGPGAFWG